MVLEGIDVAKAIRLNGLEQDGELMHADITLPDGRRHRHTFPTDTMEWRAAEYGLDPSDVDTLLEIVLAEPHLDPDPDDATRSLFAAATIEEARDHHLKKIRKIKVGRDADAWERAKVGAVMHPEAIELKAEHVRRGRDAHRTRAARAPHTEADRIAVLRAKLNTKKDGRNA